MKRLTYAHEPVLVSDETADAVIAYAAKLATLGLTESIQLRVLSMRGKPAIAGVLLTPGAEVMTLSVKSRYTEPDNDAQVIYMRHETARRVEAPERGSPAASLIFDDNEFDALFQVSAE